MRNFVMYLVLLMMSLSCSKEESLITSDNPVIGNLSLDRTFYSVKYLERDTLLFPNSIDLNKLVVHITEGDSCVTLKDNHIVIGRRKGTAKLTAKYEDKIAVITIDVTSEDMIPVDNLEFDVNGERYLSGEVSVWQSCQMVDAKIKCTNPTTTSFAEVDDISINSYDENGNLWWKPEDVAGNVHGYKEWNRKGEIESIDKMSFRIFPRTNFMLNSSPCFLLKVHMKIWPDDLIKTKWDIQQIEKAYGQDVQGIVEYSHVFAANENSITIDRDPSSDEHKENIYIRAGEKRNMTACLKVPDEFNDAVFLTWTLEDTHNEYMNQGYLKISEDGVLSLDASYNGQNYPYYNGLQKDTVYIGYIMASLLKTGTLPYNQLSDKYNCDENEGKMCYSNVKHWIKKLQKEDKVDVYWVRE